MLALLPDSRVSPLLLSLERDGMVMLPSLLTGTLLREAQRAFRARLAAPANHRFRGWYATDRNRLILDDVLADSEGLLRAALDPIVLDVADAWLRRSWQFTEAKGWRTLATDSSFHCWHGDAWYDDGHHDAAFHARVPRRLKLAVYLSDVDGGGFGYVPGSHGDVPHRTRRDDEVPKDRVRNVRGPAGTGFLFDVSGTHRQICPVPKDRDAVFLVMNDPAVPVQPADVAADRYRPLRLNAALIGGLSARERRVLGIGRRELWRSGATPALRQPHLARAIGVASLAALGIDSLVARVRARLT